MLITNANTHPNNDILSVHIIILHRIELHGIDWDAPLPTEQDSGDNIELVGVTAPVNPLSEEQYAELQMQ